MNLTVAALGLCAALAVAVPAFADWRDDLGALRIGVVMQNGRNYDPRRFEEFREIVSETLSLPVEIFQAHDAAALIDAMATSRIEYSIMSALGYATADRMCECIEPVAAPVSREGATAVRSVLVVDDARVRRIADLAAVPIAAGPANSLGGDLLPSAEFEWQGGPLADSGLDLVQAASTRESLRLLADGEVAAAFLWEFVRPGSAMAYEDGPRAALDGMSPGGFTVLWHSEPVRFGPHAVRRNLPAAAKAALRRMLVDLDEAAPLAYDSVSPALGGGFEAAGADEYHSALALVSALGTKEDR
ncbi:phosphate/phosphite/phosphonate ABC transporter substrate-binding protein [Oricola nitratireducens]|uniref:phosphate/phosphite/phosphonate ABC transporter substrate-binding protein n=1 Tax=Oricola nitratireducens TaxID=2775868 RepID=UPI0018669B1C|nr:PhnD/SsuA/transferrin family substrate-binding protein [Oricola nitratireducens]